MPATGRVEFPAEEAPVSPHAPSSEGAVEIDVARPRKKESYYRHLRYADGPAR